MRRALLISLSLVLALVGWSTVGAEDGFYVIPSMKVVPKTGQITSYDIPDHRDDGALQRGVAWPTPRFTDNGNGTVTDNLTRLIWMKNADAFDIKTWGGALTAANDLKSGDTGTGLKDGSQAGDWRLPNVRELHSLVDYAGVAHALPVVNPFENVRDSYYWTSTTYAGNTDLVWYVNFNHGSVNYFQKSNQYYVWCVRGGP